MFKRQLIRPLIALIGMTASSVSLGWLGDRAKTGFEYPQEETEELMEELDSLDPLWEEWLAPEELVKQRDKYRRNKQLKWPGSLPSIRPSGFTYYPDDFSASVSVQFDDNKIEVTVPRSPDLKKKYGYDQTAERNAVQGYLKEFLGLKKSDIYEKLAAELMIDSQQIKNMLDDNEYLMSSIFKNKSPSKADIEKMAFKILQSAHIKVQDQLASEKSRSRKKRIAFVMDLPDKRLKYAAQRYSPLVKRFSEEFNVPESLIMAVIHTESHFNPLAQSHIPAYGLMQIVPTTAGHDVAQMIYDVPPILTPDFLMDEKNNIRFGAAYLNILYYRYLSKIENEKSRAYLAIAAYNTGPSNVARAFVNVARLSEAVPVINKMSDKEVLDRLLNYAPALETRNYLAKVVAREQFYEKAMKYWD